MKQFSLSEQLPQMIYVTSQEGLPGFLFHLLKKSTLLEFYQEAQIKLTGSFCFALGRLLSGIMQYIQTLGKEYVIKFFPLSPPPLQASCKGEKISPWHFK